MNNFLTRLGSRDIFPVFSLTALVFFVKAIWVSASYGGPVYFLDELLYSKDAWAIFSRSMFPSPHYPPSYPLVLIPALFWENWYLGMLLINVFWSSLLIPATWLLARELGIKYPLLVAMLTAFLPMHLVYPQFVLSENLFVPLFILAVALALRGEKAGAGEAVFFGLVLGASHLTKYLFLPSLPLLAGVWLTLRWASRRCHAREGTCSLLYMITLVLLGYSLVIAPWLIYGWNSGFETAKMFGFGLTGIKSEAVSFGSLLMWSAAYASYVFLVGLPAWALLITWAGQFGYVRLRGQVTRVQFYFIVILLLLVGGYWLLATQHSFGATYNYPNPQYLIGRYLMHLTPLMLVVAVLGYEKLTDADFPLNRWRVLVGLAAISFCAYASWVILFRQGLWGFPDWFAKIVFNSIDVFALAKPLNFSVAVLVVVLPLVALGFRRRSTLLFVAALSIGLLFNLFGAFNVINKRDNGLHSRELVPVITKWRGSKHPIHIIVDDRWVNLTIMVVGTTPDDERDFGVEGGG